MLTLGSTKEVLMRAILLLIAASVLMAGCNMNIPNSDIDPEELEDAMFSIAPERAFDGPARLNLEFIPYEEDPGFHGWHIPYVWDADDEEMCLKSKWEVLSGYLDQLDADFVLSDVVCVRVNVTYGEDCEHNPNQDHCGWQCEGNEETAGLTADVGFEWFFGYWDQGTWSDSEGEGCSVLFCDSHHRDITDYE
jgi:hypothetical protein